MTDPCALQHLRSRRLLSVIRAPDANTALAAADAVAAGGIPILEITFTVPGTVAVIEQLARREGLVVGAGTVLTATQARDAIAAGATFIVAPNLSLAVARVALEADVMYCPGAYTTSEIIAALEAGAHIVKIYPVGVAGGPQYIQVIRDPLPGVPMLAAGGTTLENVVPFLSAGCVAVGLGGALCDARLAAAGELGEITRRARALVQRVEEARGQALPATGKLV